MQAVNAKDLQSVYSRLGFSDEEALIFLIGERKARLLSEEIRGNIGQLFARGLDGIQTKLTSKERDRIMGAVLLGRRFNLAVALSNPSISTPSLAMEIARSELRYREKEYGLVMLLNNQHQIIKHEILFIGTVDEVSMYAREIAKTALLNNASAIILAHNHPSNSMRPSPADITVTKNISEGLKLIGVKLLDHLIITDAGEISMQSNGYL